MIFLETISGYVVHTIFYEEKNGFQIAKIKATSEITISGYFPLLNKDLEYEFYGEYVTHPKYGRQFKVTSFNVKNDSRESIINYLSSDLFTGIGPKTATKIVEVLGDDCINRIIEDKMVLSLVGLKEEKIERLYGELLANRMLEETIITLAKYEVTTKMALRLFNKYGNTTIDVVFDNPYRLITDVEGYGFKKADRLALSIGIKQDDPKRIRAAIIYVMSLIERNYGYTYVTREQLIDSANSFINVESNLIGKEINHLEDQQELFNEDTLLYLPRTYHAEVNLAKRINALATSPKIEYDLDVLKDFLDDIMLELGITYSKAQIEAILLAIKNPISIITGGPGTGKTTIINGILRLYAKLNSINLGLKNATDMIALMAPTGRASKRMFEQTNMLAMTIHRHLGYSYDEEFSFNADNPFSYRLIIIDEASMIDVFLANNLFSAITNNTQVVIVGDMDQLPSVGPGAVLNDMIDANVIPVSRLTEIHRQAADSNIIKLSTAIKNGELSWNIMDYYEDLSFYRLSGEAIKNKIIALYLGLVEAGYDALTDIQILSPMYKGQCGIDELNLSIQDLLNHNEGIKIGEREFRVNDKVLQLSNQPKLGIMNGDIGIIKEIIHGSEDYLIVDFDQNLVKINKEAMLDLTLAYAISIHKSQGSEFKAVIMPIAPMHKIMLKRKILYTAVTRAKEKLMVVGDLNMFKYGINMLDEKRQTSLSKRLKCSQVIPIQIEGCPFTYLGEIDLENISPYDFMEDDDNITEVK